MLSTGNVAGLTPEMIASALGVKIASDRAKQQRVKDMLSIMSSVKPERLVETEVPVPGKPGYKEQILYDPTTGRRVASFGMIKPEPATPRTEFKEVNIGGGQKQLQLLDKNTGAKIKDVGVPVSVSEDPIKFTQESKILSDAADAAREKVKRLYPETFVKDPATGEWTMRWTNVEDANRIFAEEFARQIDIWIRRKRLDPEWRDSINFQGFYELSPGNAVPYFQDEYGRKYILNTDGTRRYFEE